MNPAAIAQHAGWAGPACYGVSCPSHAQCAHYHAVERAEPAAPIASCETSDHRYPLFELLPAVPAVPAEPTVVDGEGDTCD